MSDKVLTRIFIGMIVLGLGLLIYSQKSRFMGSNTTAYDQQSQQQIDRLNKMKTQMQELQKNQNMNGTPNPADTAQSNEQNNKEEKDNSLISRLREKTKKVLRNFQNKTFSEVTLPPELDFISIDIEDGAEAIYGYNEELQLGLTVMAIPKIVKNEEVLPYLDGAQKYLENTKNNPVAKIGSPVKLPKPKESTNLASATMWSGKLQNGDDAHIVKLERADKQGSYFYFYTGPGEYFADNEEYFQSILDNFKALPGSLPKNNQ